MNALNVWAVRDDSGNVLHIEGMIEDITERKHTEEAVAREHNLLLTLINSTPDLIYVKDTEHRYLLANKTVLRAVGRSTACFLATRRTLGSGATEQRRNAVNLVEIDQSPRVPEPTGR